MASEIIEFTIIFLLLPLGLFEYLKLFHEILKTFFLRWMTNKGLLHRFAVSQDQVKCSSFPSSVTFKTKLN